MNRNEVLSIRVDGSNPRHHIWNNHGVWWIHYTVLVGGVRQRRMRYSLGTRDEQEAARLRDRIFQGSGVSRWGRPGTRRPCPKAARGVS